MVPFTIYNSGRSSNSELPNANSFFSTSFPNRILLISEFVESLIKGATESILWLIAFVIRSAFNYVCLRTLFINVVNSTIWNFTLWSFASKPSILLYKKIVFWETPSHTTDVRIMLKSMLVHVATWAYTSALISAYKVVAVTLTFSV